MDAADRRECLAVRNAAGVLDASTLGKIEVGPDAAAFLDRMYTNRMSRSPSARSATGSCSASTAWLPTTGWRCASRRTASSSDDDRERRMVLDRFEEWLQTEWPELRVYCCVTEQWADFAIAGPRRLRFSPPWGPTSTCRPRPSPSCRSGMAWSWDPLESGPGELHGRALLRAPRRRPPGLELWEAVLGAGHSIGITPYGTEAMRPPRAEKGFVSSGRTPTAPSRPATSGWDGSSARTTRTSSGGARSGVRTPAAQTGSNSVLHLRDLLRGRPARRGRHRPDPDAR